VVLNLKFQGFRERMIQRLTWIEKKMEFMFDCHMYSELKINKLVGVEFIDYIISLWD
jgi:hypothetical protein